MSGAAKLAPGRVLRGGGYALVLRPRACAVAAALALLAMALAAAGLLAGRMALDAAQVLDALLGHGDCGVAERIVLDIRLPRVLTALFAGAALGVSGAVFQSVSRNALGSPDVIGFTAGAATGAIAQIVLFGQTAFAVALAAIAGGIGTAVIVYLLSLRGGVSGGYRLVLVGIGVGAILDAFNGLMLVKGDLDSAAMANLWRAGSLEARNWGHVMPVALGVAVLLPLVMLLARKLEMIEMGDDLARQLGIGVERSRVLALFCAVLLAALATGAAGPIAFVALAAPQLATRLTGGGLPVLASAGMAACLLLFADLATQALPLRMTLPIGRMTGIVGGLYLIWLLTRVRRA